MDTEQALTFAARHRLGILVTLHPDGRPQTSNIVYAVDGYRVRVSLTDGRVKTRSLRGDPRALLHVSTPDGSSWAALEGSAELSPVTTEPGDEAARALRDLYTTISGQEHPDWDDYDRAMIQERRVVLTLTVTHGYGGGAG